MNFRKNIEIAYYLLFVVLFAGLSCSSGTKNNQHNLSVEKSSTEWLSYLTSIGFNKNSLQNHLLLIMHPSQCGSCLNELHRWNNEVKNDVEFDITLIVIAEHAATYNAFLERQEIVLQSFQDHTTQLFDKKLIPTAPIKIFFDINNHVAIAEHIGAGNTISDFLEKIQ